MDMERMPARRFEDLVVWQKAHQFVLNVYRFSRSFPKVELYGLTSQLRRAAISVPANVAEGFSKRGPNDKVRFLNIAQGSLEEARYYLILARDPGFGDPKEMMPLAEEAGRLLQAYSRSIRASIS
jgi:four helix bundle protein